MARRHKKYWTKNTENTATYTGNDKVNTAEPNDKSYQQPRQQTSVGNRTKENRDQ